MGFNAAGLNTEIAAVASTYPYLQLHTAAPASDGSTNQSSAARVNAGWVVSGTTATASSKNFTGGAPPGPCTHISIWTALTGGTCGGTQASTGDQVFNSAGQYTESSVVLTAA